MIYFLPIEPFESRYTKQWLEWFTDTFNKMNVSFVSIIPDQLTNDIETGEVLDCVNTNYFKSKQLTGILKLLHENIIQDNDVIFLEDAWFPGLEMLEYVRRISGKNFKIAGILHAGTWDGNDFLNRYKFKEKKFQLIEESWLSILDEIYVATNFHANLIFSNFPNLSNLWDKIKVVKFPLKIKQIQNTKENIIVFPHRLDKEKRPEFFVQLKDTNNLEKIVNAKFLICKEETKTKQEYYELLSKSKISISFATQETFGIAMLESCVQGCIPLVPNILSYSEMYPEFFKYNHISSLQNSRSEFIKILYTIKKFLDNFETYQYVLPSIYSKYYYGCEEIITHLIDLQNRK